MSFFYSYCGLFAFILPYFAFILPFYFMYFHSPALLLPTIPPSENDLFFILLRHVIFDSYCGLFAFILPYFAFILPFYFIFYLFTFSDTFSLPLFIFPPQMTSADICPPSPPEEGIFQYIGPCMYCTVVWMFLTILWLDPLWNWT